MRRNVTGCESSAGPHGRPGADRLEPVGDPCRSVVEQGAHLVVVEPRGPGRPDGHQQRVRLAAVRVVRRIDDLLGWDEAIEVEQVQRAPDGRVEEHPGASGEIACHCGEVDDPGVRDDQRGRRMAVEQPGERVGDGRQATTAVDEDRNAPLGGEREDGLEARVVGKESLRARMQLDPARTEVEASDRFLDG